MAVNEKRTHFGRAGEFFAMSELLLRGWNVAVLVVDVGEDVFVIDDNDKSTRRVQVKSSVIRKGKANFTLSRAQLRSTHATPLIYMFLARSDESCSWRFFVIPRSRLLELHSSFVQAPKSGPGRRGKPHEDARTDSLTLTIDLTGEQPTAWGTSLAEFDCEWPEELPEVPDGPGRVGASS